MKVPFEQIGEGQVGRLVYQVIGKDGPILNPTNISYLPPESVQAGQTILQGSNAALLGFSGIAMVGSLAAAAVSAATLRECRRISKGIQRIEHKLELISHELSQIHSMVDHINYKVEEAHLREAIKHIYGQAITQDTIELTEIARLRSDLLQYKNAVEAGLVFNFSLKLSSDVRDSLTSLLHLLQSTRYSVIEAHNQIVDGDPLQTLSIHPINDYTLFDYFSICSVAQSIGLDDEVFNNFSDEIAAKIDCDFLFSGEESQRSFQQFCLERYYQPQNDILMDIPGTRMAFALTVAVQQLDPDFDYNHESTIERLTELVEAWLLESDAGLIYRLDSELLGLEDGYPDAFHYYTLPEKSTQETYGELLFTSEADLAMN